MTVSDSIRLLVIGVGGTIASIPTERGLTPRLSASEIFDKTIGYVPSWVKPDFLDLMKVDSSLMSPSDWVKIAQAIYYNYNDYDSFLILHGTDTMAYTASALAFMLRNLMKPVILTGSMRSLDEIDSDAPRNMQSALTFLRTFVKKGLSGVFVAFNDKIILGTRASKVSSKDLDAFASINYPYIASIKQGRVEIEHIPKRLLEESELRLEGNFEDKVFVLKAFPGIRAEFIDYLKNHLSGLVIEAYGLGGLPTGLIEKITELATKIPVVITSQPIYGGVDLRIYEVGLKLLNSGVMPACDMTKEATIVKLMWLINRSNGISDIRRKMLTNYEDEVTPCITLDSITP